MATERSELPYQTLAANEIRVVVLQKAAQFSDEIQCSFQTVTLGRAHVPSYETVSYVWGDASQREPIYLCGKAIEIPISAMSVLRRFRLTTADRLLWIDAVCINQTDMSERSQQVAMMAEIYSGAAHGLIWLGEDEGEAGASEAALDAVLADAEHTLGSLGHIKNALRATDNAGKRYANTGFHGDIDFHALRRLYGRSWFQRVWGECLRPLSYTDAIRFP